jgi:TRAP-type mannitol/chloroaromatic compound transport system permease small subunit
MEIFLSAMKGRSKWVSEAIQTTASILIISILMYFSFKHFQRAWVFGDSTIDIGLPTWPSKLMIPVALATLNLRLLIQLAGYIRLAIDPKLEPIGVPLIKDVVEQAEEEAAQIELIK